jgi:hypothetical protein
MFGLLLERASLNNCRFALTVSQPVCLGVEPPLGLVTRFKVLSLLQRESPRGILSDERVGVSVMFLGLCEVHILFTYYNVVQIIRVNIYNLLYAVYRLRGLVQRLMPCFSLTCV